MSLEVNKAVLSAFGGLRLTDDTVEYITYVPTKRLLEVLGYVQTTDYNLPGAIIFVGNGLRDFATAEELQTVHGEVRLLDGEGYSVVPVTAFVKLGKPLLHVLPSSLRNDVSAA